MSGPLIGYVYANIASDVRYTSGIRVTVDGDKAHVIRVENGALGGMDGHGGTTPFSNTAHKTVAVDAKQIVKAIKDTLDDILKRYGKVTQRFVWLVDGGDEYGLSLAKCQQALDFIA